MVIESDHSKWFKIHFFILLGMFFISINLQAVDSIPQYKSEKTISAKEALAEGQKQWQKGELEKALLTLEKAVELDTSSKQVLKVLRSMQLQKKKIDGLLKEASSFIDQNNYKDAKKSLKKASWISSQYEGYQKVFQDLEKKDLSDEMSPAKVSEYTTRDKARTDGSKTDLDQSKKPKEKTKYVKGDPVLADLADPNTPHKKLSIAKDAKDRKLQKELKEKVADVKTDPGTKKKATKKDFRDKIRSQGDLDTQVGDNNGMNKSNDVKTDQGEVRKSRDKRNKRHFDIPDPVPPTTWDNKRDVDMDRKDIYSDTDTGKKTKKRPKKKRLGDYYPDGKVPPTQISEPGKTGTDGSEPDTGKKTKKRPKKKRLGDYYPDGKVPPAQISEPGITKKGDAYTNLRKKYKDLAGSMDINSKEFKSLMDRYAADFRALNKKKPSIGSDINIRKKRTPMNVDANIPGKGDRLMDAIDITEVAEVAFQGFQKATEEGGKAIDANKDLNSSSVVNVVKYITPGIAEKKATEAALKKRRLDELSDSPEIRKLKEKRHALRNKKRKEGDPNWETAALDTYDEYLLAQAEKKKQQALEKSLQRQKRNKRIKELRSKKYSNDLTFDEGVELAGLEGEQVEDGVEDVKNMALDKFQSYVDKMQKKRKKEGRDKDEFIKDGIPMFLEMMRDGFNLINPASQIGTPVAEGFAEMTTWEKRQAWASSKDDWTKKVNLEVMKIDKNTRRNVNKLNQLLTDSDICDKNIQNQIEILLSQLRADSEKLNQLNIFAYKALSEVDPKKLKSLRSLRISMPDVKSLKQWEEQLIEEKCKPDDAMVSSDKKKSSDNDNGTPLQIVYRIKGSGYTPHYGGGSYENVGYNDVLVTLKEVATEQYIQSILDKVKAKYNTDICSVGIAAYPSGSRPPAIWKQFDVTITRGPASGLSNVKLENTWKSEGRDGPSLSELKKGCSK